jgi:hypothetical protein
MAATRIYTAFSSSGLFGSTQTFPLHHPDIKVMSNEETLGEIRARCEGVEFIGSTRVETPAYTIANVLAQTPSLDGLLYFGHLPPELMESGLPTLAVYPLWGQWQEEYQPYHGSRVLTATLPVIADSSPSVFASRLEAIANKIRLLQMVSRLKDLRILCITDHPILGEYEPTAYQTAREGGPEYQSRYLQNLASLGSTIIVRPQAEMVTRLEAAPERAAADVAHRWIAEAEDIKGTNEAEIRKSARLYLAMKEMMGLYGANAITTEGYGIFMNYPGGPIPSQGLPSSQFCTDGVVATSETLVDSLLTQQLGLWMTGSTGFNGDYIVDTDNDKVYVGHCECTFDPLGNGQRVPYVIRNLPQWPIDQQEKGGACVRVHLPTDGTVTLAKISVHDKKLVVFTGKAVDGGQLFPGWDDILCRTKLAIDVDAQKVFANLDWWTFGQHRVVFYGDYRQRFKDLATVLGYEVVEDDR